MALVPASSLTDDEQEVTLSVGKLKELLHTAQTQSMKFGGGLEVGLEVAQTQKSVAQEQLSPFGGVVSPFGPFVGNGGTAVPMREDKVVDFDEYGNVLRVHVSRSVGCASFKSRGIRKAAKKNGGGGGGGGKRGGHSVLSEMQSLGLI